MHTSDRLSLLTRAAAGDPAARQQAAEILLAGVAAYLRHGGELSLERCLGIPPPSACRRLALAKRDYWLGEARRYLEGPPWSRSVALADAARHFLGTIWPAWRDLDEPPPYASDLRAALFRAAKAAGGRLPATARQMHRLISDADSPGNVGHEPASWNLERRTTR
jgi:hypothetical protein